jgi:hypothetical protein
MSFEKQRGIDESKKKLNPVKAEECIILATDKDTVTHFDMFGNPQAVHALLRLAMQKLEEVVSQYYGSDAARELQEKMLQYYLDKLGGLVFVPEFGDESAEPILTDEEVERLFKAIMEREQDE